MPIVRIDHAAYLKFVSVLSEKRGPLSIRIEIRSTGCCDASLGLRVDDADSMDLVEQLGDLKFLINSEIYDQVGDVFISYVNEDGIDGFKISSQNPLNEWEGFAVSNIRWG